MTKQLITGIILPTHLGHYTQPLEHGLQLEQILWLEPANYKSQMADRMSALRPRQAYLA
jgi:hypothetical protein